MKRQTLVIVGVGLIGGSIALAAKRGGVVGRVLGVGHRQSTLDRARELGIIEEGFLEIPPAVAEADMVVLCTPVDLIVEQVILAGRHCPRGAVITDAGSTKTVIVRSVEKQLPEGVTFVGSHPLAGSEKRGPEHAQEVLFQDRLTIVTPTESTEGTAVSLVCDFWQALGSRIKVMTPEDHDRGLALTSHLPHLLASALAGVLPEDLYELTATGFRDTTRIAAGDSSVWSGIFQQNREAVLAALEIFASRLSEFQKALTTDNVKALDSLLREGKKVRDALGN